MPDTKHVVTEEEFAFFERKVREFVERAGLGIWQIYCEQGKHKRFSGWLSVNYAQKKAFIILNAVLPRTAEKDIETELTYIAAHEVGELMLTQMRWMAENYYAASIVDEYAHEAINGIVRLFLAKETSCHTQP